MRYEVVEEEGAWSVRSEGRELARFADQGSALADVADRLKSADGQAPAGLSVRYLTRNA